MLLLGLTGSIATGKSTVSSILREPPYSLPIIDADVIARQVVEPGTAGYAAIVKNFAPSTPDLLLDTAEAQADRNGRPLNRAALGRRVFGDSEERKRARAVLNGIVHPAVRREMFKQVVRCYVRGCWAVVLDVPLLFESGLDTFCGAVLVVAVAAPEVQMKRLRERDVHLSEEDARNRVLSQTDVRVKARRCGARGVGRGLVVWNDGGREELKTQIDAVMGVLGAASPRWWSWVLLLCPPAAAVAAAWTFWQNRKINERWKEEELREKSKL